MNKYKVIWFDDEFHSLNIIKENASLNGITLIGFSNAKDGIEDLENNLLQYDAAIVDGKFYRKPGQSGDATDDHALFDVGRAIERLSVRKSLPWFILSGQISFTKGRNPFADAFKANKVYDKTREEDLESLWTDLKTEADNQEDTQIRNDYHRIFELCTDKYIGLTAAKDLLAILRKGNTVAAFTDPDLYFNPLRKVLEDFFKACNKWGFLPDIFIKGGVALNESSKFLSGGVEKGYQLDRPAFPKIISDNVRSILAACQPASHRSEIDSFVSKIHSPYLLLSITYQLLDVLLWLKIYTDENIDVDLNKSKYKPIELALSAGSVTGIIEQDRSNNYHCGDVILTYRHVTENGYKAGDAIRIIKAVLNSNDKTMHLYTKSVISSERA